MGDLGRSQRRRGVLVVSWVRYQGRSEALARWLGGEAVFLSPGPSGRALTAPLRYLRETARTWWLLARRRPAGVVVMLPPFPALLAVLAAALVLRARVVADMHSGVFEEPRWKWALRPTLFLARRAALTVVTNASHAALLAQAGVAHTRLHDPPEEPVVDGTAPAGDGDRFVLVPSSYGHDEPVGEVLRAAATLPDLRFVLTGSAPEPVRAAAPGNVSFPGYVSRRDYDALVAGAAVICCLTTDENTMQRGGYEALANHIPLVTSDTAALREFFDGAAVHVRPEAADIATGIRRAVDEGDELRRRLEARHEEQLATFGDDLEPVRRALGIGG